MKPFARIMLLTLGFGMLTAVVGVFTTPSGRAIAASLSNVFVTNTSATPVPVTGTVGVSGTPNVNATISGTPSVTIAGTPNVNATISGTPSVNATLAMGSMVALDPSQTFAQSSTFAGAAKSAVVTVNAYDGRQPYFQDILAAQGNCVSCASGNFSVNAPGKRLVIEFLSANLTISSGVPFTSASFEVVHVSPIFPQVKGIANLVPVKLGTDGTMDFYAANQNLRLYADDGDFLEFNFASASAATENGILFVHGYFIDAP